MISLVTIGDESWAAPFAVELIRLCGRVPRKDSRCLALQAALDRAERIPGGYAKVLTMDEARRGASNIAKLPTLLGAAVALLGTLRHLVERSAQAALVRFQDLDEDSQLLVAR